MSRVFKVYTLLVDAESADRFEELVNEELDYVVSMTELSTEVRLHDRLDDPMQTIEVCHFRG